MNLNTHSAVAMPSFSFQIYLIVAGTLTRHGASVSRNKNPVYSSEAGILFTDHLGSTTGALRGNGEFSPVAMTAFGETEDEQAFFTGKPFVEGLGYAFLLRNYRPDHGKWLTADPLGYPDGWNDLAYCGNSPNCHFDFLGGSWTTSDFVRYYYSGDGVSLNLSDMELDSQVWGVLCSDEDSSWGNGGVYYYGRYYSYSTYGGGNPTGFISRLTRQLKSEAKSKVIRCSNGNSFSTYITDNGYNFSPVVWAMGGGVVYSHSSGTVNWYYDGQFTYYSCVYSVTVRYSDIFKEPIDIPGVESPGGSPYLYDQVWGTIISVSGKLE